MKLRLDSKHRLRYKSTAYKIFHFIGKSLLFLFIIFLMLVGFTQTSYFRNLLRDKVIDYARQELNGNLNIESIYGTLFSSLTIKNINYSIDGVEFISAKTLHVSINPIALIQQKIVVNKVFLENAHFNLVKFKDGKWITEKILKHPIEKDTTKGAKFNYDVVLKSIVFSDCNFSLRKDIDSSSFSIYRVYDAFNYNDLIISNLNLNISSRLNFSKNVFELNIKDFNFKSNVKDFSLENFNLNLLARNNKLQVEPLKIKTNNTDLNIYLKIDDFNLSDSTLFENLPSKIFDVRLEASPFSFQDLRSLIPSVNMLNGNIFVQAEAKGSLKNLNVEYISAKIDSSRLFIQGNLRNLDETENMYIKARVVNSEILMQDVSNLLPHYSIPKFDGLGKLKLEISYDGRPLNFKTDFKIITSTGELNGFSKFNFARRIPSYFVDISTKNLPFYPFTGIEGYLNSKLSVSGEGFSPDEINTELKFFAQKSLFAGNRVDTLELKIEGKNKKFDFNFLTKLEDSNLLLNGFVDFVNRNLPVYEFDITMKNVDPARNLFLKDFNGNLNVAGILKGKSFNPDNLDAKFDLRIFESILNKVQIDSSSLILVVNHSNPDSKEIRLRSDFLDFNLSGKYQLTEVLKVLPDKIDLVQKEIDKKIKLFKEQEDSSVQFSTVTSLTTKKLKKERKTEPEFNFVYNLNFKDFNLINVFLKKTKINVDVNLSGKVSNDAEKFNFETQGNIDDFWIVELEQSIRARNASFKLALESTNKLEERSKLKLFTSFDADKILTTSKLENLDIKIDYDSDLFQYSINSTIDSLLSVRSEGTFDISSPEFKASISKATIVYKKYKLTNQGALNFSFTKDKVRFDQFVLRRKRELFKLNGEFGYQGEQNLSFNVEGLELYDLVLNFFPNITEEVGGELSINLSLNGIAESPMINGSFDLSNLSIGDDKLGNFSGGLIYKNKILDVMTSYIDSVYEGKDLDLKGTLPIDLSLTEVKERLPRNEKFQVYLSLNNFNLQPLRAIVPIFKTIDGSLNGNIEFTGTLDKPEFYGKITSSNVNFLLAQNNLKYSVDLTAELNKNKILLERFEISNLNARKRGKLYTNAELEIDSRGIKDLKITSQGSLLVLGNESRGVSPKVYGDLFFETASPIVVEGSYNNYFINGEINIRESSLIIPPIQSEYSSEEEMFVYRFVNYAPQIDSADLAFIQAEKEIRGDKKTKAQSSSNILSRIRGKIKISLKNNVSMSLIFNQELNQRLYADLKGEVFYNFSEDVASTQGEIELTQNSFLVFYKRFLASGKIRFENELSNPYLDVTATYSDYYVRGDTVNQQVKDVLIKLHLLGKVTEIGKNLVNNKENIQVYIDGNLDQTKDASDVVSFVLIGKFKDDLTAEDKTGALSNWGGTFQSAASSLLGSVITNFANNILGDVLRNVEFKKVGEQTKFSFEGRVKDVRFVVGGGTDVFQNFALANIQIEYPVSEKLFLRLVRKQAQLQVSKPTEMINEVGLKYKVEF